MEVHHNPAPHSLETLNDKEILEERKACGIRRYVNQIGVKGTDFASYIPAETYKIEELAKPELPNFLERCRRGQVMVARRESLVH